MASYCPEIRPADWLEQEDAWDWPQTLSEELRLLHAIDERVRKALARPHAAAVPSIEEQFRQQAEKWKRETKHLSSPTQKLMHPSYQAILGMGRDVLPLMLRDLAQNRTEWFWALSYITHENPISREDAGKMDKMIWAWVNWGTAKGLL